MFISRREINYEQMKELNFERCKIQDYLFTEFYNNIVEEEFNKGYICELLKTEFEINSYRQEIVCYLTYRVWEDKDFNNVQERLNIGL